MSVESGGHAARESGLGVVRRSDQGDVDGVSEGFLETLEFFDHFWAAIQDGLGEAFVIDRIPFGQLGQGKKHGEGIVHVVF